jgi:DNA (cytosine-5)-methyltransferase 1
MTQSVHHAVSLFSNCGAGDVGYAKAGFKFDVMAEIDERRLSVCLLNHPGAIGVPGDLRETWKKVVSEYRRVTDDAPLSLLAACPPCQGMSSARSGRGHESDPDAGTKDARNLLVMVIANVCKALKPQLLIVENVQAFLTRKIRHPATGAPISAARLLIEELQRDYMPFPVLMDLCEFGVPQTRKRSFITFVRRDLHCLKLLEEKALSPYPLPSHAEEFGGRPVTLREALANFDLESLDASSPRKAAVPRYAGLHSVPVWSRERYAMVSAIPKHTGRSAWQNERCERCGKVNVHVDEAICPGCRGPLLRPVIKDKGRGYRLINGFRSSTYCRMKSDSPAATITTATGHIGSNHTIHPYENRVFSILECALLQTFPRRFRWGDALQRYGHTNVREMIGEAVPPLFTQKHGEVLMKLLKGSRRIKSLPALNARCTRAAKRLSLSEEVHHVQV